MNTKVNNEVKEAYADCHCGDDEKDYMKSLQIRNLNFCASESVSPSEAKEIMSKYVPDYNGFSVSVLDKFPESSEILIARQGSVCLYAKGKKLPNNIAEEEDKKGVWKRYWWD